VDKPTMVLGAFDVVLTPDRRSIHAASTAPRDARSSAQSLNPRLSRD
jgi:hypothetical protein